MRYTLPLIFAMTLTGSLGCGSFFDGDSRDGALGPNDDLILPENDGDSGDPQMVCEYPPVLSNQHFSADLRDCAKLEGGQIGEDMTLEVNGETVVISDWINKENEGEYVGFSVDGDVVVVVKAGQDLFEAGEGDWVHPGGTEGPNAKGISFVAFCEPPTDEPVCTPTDGPGGSGDPGDGSGDPGDGSGDPGDGSGDPGDGGSGDGGSGDGGSGDDDGYCDPYTCEPGGNLAGDGDDGSGGGGDGSGGSDGGTDDGSGSGDGSGSSSGGDGTGTDDGSGGSGSSGEVCAISPCDTNNPCSDNNQACFGGCCLEVIL